MIKHSNKSTEVQEMSAQQVKKAIAKTEKKDVDKLQKKPKASKTEQKDGDKLQKKPKASKTEPISVTIEDTYIYIKNTSLDNEKPIAGFDLDSTIIKTKSGKVMPKSADDWQFMFTNSEKKIRELSNDYNIIIFTNQKGLGGAKNIEKNIEKVNEFINKIKAIIDQLKVPIQIYASTSDGFTRKPYTGMWELCNQPKNDQHFYCGDAAGREGDFAATDLMFANNVGIAFRTPEYIFKEETQDVEYEFPSYLTKYIGKAQPLKITFNKPTLVLMCGFPACGKSTLAKKFQNAIIVSNDDLGTKSKCIKAAKSAMLEGKNIIVDNTNHTLVARIEYYDLASKWITSQGKDSYKIIVIHIENDMRFCYYMNQLRVQQSRGSIKPIPKVAYHTINKNANWPTENEYVNMELIKRNTLVLEYKYQFPSI